MTSKEETIRNFLNNTKHYKNIPALIKNSPCDHNAKICVKAGYVRLVATTKTGNTYKITAKGVKFILQNIQPEKHKILKLIKM